MKPIYYIGEDMNLKIVIYSAAAAVFVICFYAFLLANEVFEGKFENEAFGWYFLAKGIFCGLSLYLSYHVLQALRK